MEKVTLTVLAVAILAVGAWAADLAVDVAPPAAGKPQGNNDNTVELKWDTGVRGLGLAWYTGAGSWVANDFNISTVKTYPWIGYIRIYSSTAWPNTIWDGMRYAIFGFSGGVPGSFMWGPYFYRPTTGTGWCWVDLPVQWILPPGVYAFAAGVEQFYNYPNCDPHALDNNPTFMGHSWQYYQGTWSPHEGYPSYPYRNLMLRVLVDNEHNPNVEPASMGRVKALYR